MINRATPQTAQDKAQRCKKAAMDTEVLCMNNTDVHPMARAVQGVVESIISYGYAGSSAKKVSKDE